MTTEDMIKDAIHGSLLILIGIVIVAISVYTYTKWKNGDYTND